jgi:predicted ATP-grasp superfamily ATP-dependent carboligase
MPTAKDEETTPVVVVGEGLNCLGVLRSLERAGLHALAVTTTRRCVVACSRHARVALLPSLEGRTLVDGLKAIGAGFAERPVLMLGGDRQVAAVNEAREELEPLFHLGLPAQEMVRTLADKALFHRFAEARGLPVPRTVVIRDGDAAGLAALADLVPPFVIKPADKAQALSGRVERAACALDLAQARDLAARMASAAGSVVVQEWIPGADSDLYFGLFACAADGRVIGLFCGRKLVCSPPAVGNTALCAPAGAVADDVAALTLRFVAESQYRGIGGLEFKRDCRSGRLVIVEPTVGRTDWQSEVATLNGVNLPVLAALEELGLARPGAAASRTRPQDANGAQVAQVVQGVERAQGAAVLPPTDLATPRAVPPRGVAWRASITHRRPRALASDVRLVDGYFRLDDPLPAAYHYLVDEFARRALRRLARLPRAWRARRHAGEEAAAERGAPAP